MTRSQLQKTIKKLIELSFKDERIIENQVLKSIKLLKSLPELQAIQTLSEYLRQLKRKQRQYTMYIETTTPLSIAQLKEMKKVVEKKHKITKIETKVNPQILGGFKLRIGDKVWDESMLGRVNQIKEAIISGRSN